MNRRVWIGLVTLVCLGLAGVIVFHIHQTSRPGITRANLSRVKPGMTLAQVEEILGERSLFTTIHIGGQGSMAIWNRDTLSVTVVFDEEGRAMRLHEEPNQ